MLKQIIAFIVLLCFLTQTFSKAFIVVGYYSNKSSFARNCENKAKPKMHCNGKCQMMKKLKQEENKDQQLPERKAGNKEEVLSTRSFFATIIPHTSEKQLPTFTITDDRRVKDMPHSFFHPPGA